MTQIFQCFKPFIIIGNTDNSDNVGNFQYPNPAAIYPGIPGVNGAPACERNSYAPEDEVCPLGQEGSIRQLCSIPERPQFYEIKAPRGQIKP